ncbi:DUF1565 domain-containing protein, partial [Corallococcus sp. CA054B]|uniref:DUF1565 domain-containing protein n=1 Tax=Corallococcus sp. CA054B TaxID=2316734 RepID=UPI000EA03F77
MRNLWKVGALGAVFGAVLSAGGCSNFDAAFENCESEGRCGPQATADAGTDAGDAGDAGDTTPPPCGDGGVDYPDLAGFDNDCDGIDGVADAGYFVHPTDGRDEGNDGSRTHPFRTLARALREIRDGGTGRNIVYLGTGTYNEEAPVVDMPVSLYGGYTWRGGENPFWDRFLDGGATTFFDGGTLAFTVRDVAGADVVMEGLTIASADALNAGEPSIALRVLRSSVVRLRHVLVEAGRGADGEMGAPGNPGAPGGAGLDGGSAVSFGSGRRGDGGSSVCSTGDAGLGGIGGTGNNFQQGFDGGDGFPNTPGGAGGAAGNRVNTGPDVYSCIAEQGLNGATGAVGGAGGLGSAGQGIGSVLPETGLWQRSNTQQGTAGDPGRIGAGGGGGGGGGTCSDSSLSPQDLGGAG